MAPAARPCPRTALCVRVRAAGSPSLGVEGRAAVARVRVSRAHQTFFKGDQAAAARQFHAAMARRKALLVAAVLAAICAVGLASTTPSTHTTTATAAKSPPPAAAHGTPAAGGHSTSSSDHSSETSTAHGGGHGGGHGTSSHHTSSDGEVRAESAHDGLGPQRRAEFARRNTRARLTSTTNSHSNGLPSASRCTLPSLTRRTRPAPFSGRASASPSSSRCFTSGR